MRQICNMAILNNGSLWKFRNFLNRVSTGTDSRSCCCFEVDLSSIFCWASRLKFNCNAIQWKLMVLCCEYIVAFGRLIRVYLTLRRFRVRLMPEHHAPVTGFRLRWRYLFVLHRYSHQKMVDYCRKLCIKFIHFLTSVWIWNGRKLQCVVINCR